MSEGDNHDRSDAIAKIMLEFGRARDAYFDPETATDGPFNLLLTTFLCRGHYEGVAVDVLMNAADVRMSTALYVIDRLVDWGYIERAGTADDERYRIPIATERNIEGYLSECSKIIDRLISDGRSKSAGECGHPGSP